MSYCWRQSAISQSTNIREGGSLGPFRNNFTYDNTATKFIPPENKICCGSAYGSGHWWPDLGGYRGAPDCNRWKTPAESWFENNVMKFREDDIYRKQVQDLNHGGGCNSTKTNIPYGFGGKMEIGIKMKNSKAFRMNESIQKLNEEGGRDEEPVDRKFDPFIKTRERMWIEMRQAEGIRKGYEKRMRKFSNSMKWKENFNCNSNSMKWKENFNCNTSRNTSTNFNNNNSTSKGMFRSKSQTLTGFGIGGQDKQPGQNQNFNKTLNNTSSLSKSASHPVLRAINM